VPITFLTSRQNGLVNVYDVSRTADQLVHVHNPPYALPSSLGFHGRHRGFAYFRDPIHFDEPCVNFFQLGLSGDVHTRRYCPSEGSTKHSLVVEWSGEVTRLNSKASSLQPTLTLASLRESTQVDLHLAYKSNRISRIRHYIINALPTAIFTPRQDVTENEISRVQELLARMSSFHVSSNAKAEQVMTT
jgi:hypothetical protein